MKICFVAHNAFGAVSGGERGHIGGIERQISLMGRWLSSRGFEITVLTWDEGQDDKLEIDGINIIKLCDRNSGIPGLRFFSPRWTSLIKAMRLADADIYYQNGAEYVTGQVALWCKLNRKKFIYSVASDPDCDIELPKMPTLREKVLYRYGLRNTNHIIVQTIRQQEMLRNNFSQDSQIIGMPCPGPDPSWLVPTIHERQPKNVLWVGRIAPVKQLELLLDMAEAAPDLVFDVVGPLDNNHYVISLQTRAKKLANVILRGAVKRADMPEYYTTDAVLCCTSSYEGFPNTFLEAWGHGMPVISTVDPDNLIKNLNLGRVGSNPSELLSSIRLLLTNPECWSVASANARRYFLQNHTEEKVLPRFENVFLSNLIKK